MTTPATPPLVPLDYGGLRLRWCAQALRRFLRRWAVMAVVAACVLGAGQAGPAGVAGLAGWLVLPLAWASAHGLWLVPAWLVQVLVGTGLLWGARALLWPAAWREAERALPVRRGALLRSDALVVALALLPWWLLQALGTAGLLAAAPAWLQGHSGVLLAALGLAAAATAVLGVLGLHLQRHGGPSAAAAWGRALRGRGLAGAEAPGGPAATPAAAAAAGTACFSGPVLRALLWLPLVRGPARRTGRALALTAGGLAGMALAVAALPAAAGWWLGAASLCALVGTSRVCTLAALELTALHAACAALPVPPQHLRLLRGVLPLLAVAPGLCLVAAAFWQAASPGAWRPAVLLAWVLAGTGASALQGWWASMAPATDTPAATAALGGDAVDPATQSAVWLLCLALCVALGSEVLR